MVSVNADTDDSHAALHLLGVAAQTEGDYARAEACYEKALVAMPGYAFSRLALAQLRMMRTRFREGRDLYEARFEAVTEGSGPDWRGLPIPRWRGESLAGKHLYLWAEQGLGDIMMFAAFLPHLLAQSPKRIALGMFPKLITLFARSFPGIEVEPIDDAGNHALAPTMLNAFPQIEKLAAQADVPFSLAPLKASYDYAKLHGLFDMAAPLGDVLVHCLPGFVPAEHQAAYLVADPLRVAELKQKLGGQGRSVGISWHTQNRREPQRNVDLPLWLPVLAREGRRFVSLQHHVEQEAVDGFCTANGCKIMQSGVDLVQDAEGLTALIAAMDEVITIDNSNAHLAGALGVKTTLLLPKGANFRWPELEQGKTLWYKSVTTLRQEIEGDWKAVMAQVAAGL